MVATDTHDTPTRPTGAQFPFDSSLRTAAGAVGVATGAAVTVASNCHVDATED